MQTQNNLSGCKVSNTAQHREYAIHKAKLECPCCSIPIGELIVTSHNVKFQDQYVATTADRLIIQNISFKGQCLVAPGMVPPPCMSVIRLGQWQNYSPDVSINGNQALLKNSTIPCILGGTQIRIVDSGQKVITIERLKEPRIISVTWIDDDQQEIDLIEAEQLAHLRIETIDYEPGETLEFTLIDPFGQEQTLTGQVDSEGIVIYKQAFKTKGRGY